MSKLQLKRMLAEMDRDQLCQLVTELYSAKKEIKEYLEFFLNPDVNALATKYEKRISKEMMREKRRYSKARISYIKKYLKEFESFQPGFEHIIKLSQIIVMKSVAMHSYLYVSETFDKGMAKIMLYIIDLADRNYVLETTLKQFDAIIHDERFGALAYRKFLQSELTSHLSTIRTPLQKQ